VELPSADIGGGGYSRVHGDYNAHEAEGFTVVVYDGSAE